MVRAAIASALCLAVCACANVDRVVFVTSTEIGIGADATAGTANIGYDRNELVIGPVYPETGALPPVYARLKSDLSIFQPAISQLYATGEAARLATDRSRKITGAPSLSGVRRVMVFGSATNLGLKVRFVEQVPTSMNLGYKRLEFSQIPLRATAPTPSHPDKYASVLANIELNVATATLNETGVRLSQFIATGDAANNLATNEEIRNYMSSEAEKAIDLKRGKYGADEATRKITAFWKLGALTGQIYNPVQGKKISACMQKSRLATTAGSITMMLQTKELAEPRKKVAECLGL